MTGDSELLRQYAQDRSEAAFAELVRRHIDFVYGIALRHARSTHRAEDATQAVFTDLARKAGSVAPRTELVGWLYTSARYAAYKIVRQEVRREQREQEAELMQSDANSPEPAVAALVGLPEARSLGAESRAFPYQQMTAELASDLTTDEPLAAPAAAQLTAILQKNNVYSQPDGWPEAIAAAKKVLSPTQSAVLRTYAASWTGVEYPSGGRR